MAIPFGASSWPLCASSCESDCLFEDGAVCKLGYFSEKVVFPVVVFDSFSQDRYRLEVGSFSELVKVGSLSEMGNSAVLIFKCSSQNLYSLKMSLLLDLEEGCGSGLFSFVSRSGLVS